MAISYIPEQKPYKNLTPFKRYVLQSFPWIDEDFDALTNKQLLAKIIEYLNDVIANGETLQENVESLYNAFVELYNYFNNLDLQDEVNNKLDEMVENGTLENLLEKYFNKIYIQLDIEENENITNYLNEKAINGNVTLIFPMGRKTYLIDDSINLYDNTTIIGNGSIIKWNTLYKNDCGMINLNGNNINIKGLTLDGNIQESGLEIHTYSHTEANGVSGIFNNTECSNILIENCVFDNIQKFGVVINTENSENIKIRNNIINFSNRDGFWVTASNVTIENNKIYNSHDNSIVFDSSFNNENSSFENYKILNNTVYYSHEIGTEINLSEIQFIPNSAQAGIFIYGKTANDIKNVVISNNIIYSSYNSINLINAKNVEINNNIICNYTNQNAQGSAFLLNNVNNINITNNNVLGSRNHGVSTTEVENINISNNIINSNNYSISSTNNDLIIRNNILKNNNNSFVALNNLGENSFVENNNIISNYTSNFINNNLVNARNNIFNNSPQKFFPYIKTTDNTASATQVNLNYDVNIINTTVSITNLVIGGSAKKSVLCVINNTSENQIHIIKGSGTYKGKLDEYIGAGKSLILTFEKYGISNYALTSVINET